MFKVISKVMYIIIQGDKKFFKNFEDLNFIILLNKTGKKGGNNKSALKFKNTGYNFKVH